jgi:hypothetical protein
VNRRGFIAAFAAFASSAVLDPEELLWVPGAKTISIPAMTEVPFMNLGMYGIMYEDWKISIGDYMGIPRSSYPLMSGPISTKPVRVPFRINASA